MAKSLPSLVLLFASILSVGCGRSPSIVEYQRNGLDPATGGMPSFVPIILVGQIVAYSELGRSRSSRWDATNRIQLCRIIVRVENVLRGGVARDDVPVFFFVSVGSTGGPPQLGMIGRTGR